MRYLVCLSASIALAGCGAEAEEPAWLIRRYTNTDTPDVQVAPEPGDWRYRDVRTVSSDCGPVEDHLPFQPGDAFTVTDASPSAFALWLDPVGEETECWMDAEDFACDAMHGRSEIPDHDASFLITVSAMGTVHNAGSQEGLYEVDIDCEGAACLVAAAAYGVNFPCYIAVHYTARSDGP